MTSNFSTHTLDAFARPVAGQALDTPVDQTTLVNLHSDAIEAVEGAFLNQGIYTPAVNGNGLTVSTGSIIGTYIDYGKAGVLTLGLSVTANWSGAGYLSCSLPPGWTAAGVESLLTGYAYEGYSIVIRCE